MDGGPAAWFGASLNPAKGSDVFSMQISVKLAALFSFVFAAICLWFAVDAFKSLQTSPTRRRRPALEISSGSGAFSPRWEWCSTRCRGRSLKDRQKTKMTDRA